MLGRQVGAEPDLVEQLVVGVSLVAEAMRPGLSRRLVWVVGRIWATGLVGVGERVDQVHVAQCLQAALVRPVVHVAEDQVGARRRALGDDRRDRLGLTLAAQIAVSSFISVLGQAALQVIDVHGE